jgi:hypothetical protein
MTLEYLYSSFKALETVEDKVKFLEDMAKLDLPYEINWNSLVQAWLSQAEQ